MREGWKLIAEKVPVKVALQEYREVDIYLNEFNNLEFVGIGSVTYDMLDEELWFTKYEE